MELWLVADTNLFFECKSLEQLPWGELSHDPVVILLTKPVLDEIDKHKNGTGRTRARALEIFGLVRSMLETSKSEIELQASSPRVLIRLEKARPNPALKEELDYQKTDEKLVGIVSTLHTASTERVVELFTDDTGPASTASGMGLPFRMINASWRRPPLESTEAKKIRELEKDLTTYRAQEPQIRIEDCEGASSPNLIEVTRQIADPLTSSEIEEILISLRAKHPMKMEFIPPSPSSDTKLTGEIVRIEYLPPAEEAVREYKDVLYPQWLSKCHSMLARLHEGHDLKEPILIVHWPMSNTGTRPALQVRIEFEAKGPIALLRLPKKDSDDLDMVAEPPRPLGVSRLPSAPRPPAFQENVTLPPPPARPKPMLTLPNGLPLAASEILKQHDDYFRRHMVGLDRTSLIPSSHQLAMGRATEEAARLFARPSTFGSPFGSGFDAVATPAVINVPRLPFSSPKHDPEAFYWDWPAHKAVKKGALTCDLWRHRMDVETFTFKVEFEKDGATRGTVVCTVHAENLTKPEQTQLIVGRTVEHYSVKQIARAMVDSCT